MAVGTNPDSRVNRVPQIEGGTTEKMCELGEGMKGLGGGTGVEEVTEGTAHG